jgi:hypothetical protein
MVLLFNFILLFFITFTISRYKSFKEALNLASKSNSTAGATAAQIATNSTSLLVMQHKKCPAFEAFNLIFGESPNCKPVDPREVGSFEAELNEDLDEGVADLAEAEVKVWGPTIIGPPSGAQDGGCCPRSKAAVTAGKPAAPFHLAPSKKVFPFPFIHHDSPFLQDKKMDLGEAYLKAQQTRIESIAISTAAKTRCDLLIALTLQGKSATEVAQFLALAGL